MTVTRMMAAALLLCVGCHAPISPASTRPAAPVQSTASSGFPSGWAGRWVGALELWSPGATSPSRLVPMVHEVGAVVEPGRGYRWRSVYDGDTVRTMKDYRLRATDSVRGRWVIDEGNGIILPARVVGNTLISVFAVAGQEFLSQETVRGDTLTIEITYWRGTPTDTLRGAGGGVNAEGGMTVHGFAVAGVQRARLVRDARR